VKIRKKLSVSLTILFLSGCVSLPKGPLGISDPAVGGLQVHDSEIDEEYFLPYGESENWLCTTPERFEKIIRACTADKK